MGDYEMEEHFTWEATSWSFASEHSGERQGLVQQPLGARWLLIYVASVSPSYRNYQYNFTYSLIWQHSQSRQVANEAFRVPS